VSCLPCRIAVKFVAREVGGHVCGVHIHDSLVERHIHGFAAVAWIWNFIYCTRVVRSLVIIVSLAARQDLSHARTDAALQLSWQLVGVDPLHEQQLRIQVTRPNSK
jgi:hypothetical protein